MAKLSSLFSDKFKKTKQAEETLPEVSNLSGIFKITDLSEVERNELKEILFEYNEESETIDQDLTDLMQITSEVKAINNQAIILHGERIKKAQTILKRYKDGAFTAWLITTYGNRQTPYNFLQYYDFYKNLTPYLREKISEMPKQAIYTLASREGSIEKKQELVETYQGESKKDVLDKIRAAFPLDLKDKRQSNLPVMVIKALERVLKQTQTDRFSPSKEEKEQIEQMLTTIKRSL
jgi:hypothetical protein